MAAIIKGITVELLERAETGRDDFNAPIFTETAVDVENVLVAPISDEERAEATNLTGRKAVYQLGIPKNDAHAWTSGTRVRFFGQTWRIIGEPVMGMESMIPMDWNMKVRVERCV